MKKWFIALTISTFISCVGLVYFIGFMVKDGCLDAGGRWNGVVVGCEGGNGYSMAYLLSPLAISIFLAIIISMSSALVQLHSMMFKSRLKKG